MRKFDLELIFHRETGKTRNNYDREYFEWLENKMIEKFEEEEQFKTWMNKNMIEYAR